MSLYDELKKLTKAQCVEFAIIKAESVINLIEDCELKALSKTCIDCAAEWIKSPTKENQNRCLSAADAAADADAYADAYADAALAAANAAAADNYYFAAAANADAADAAATAAASDAFAFAADAAASRSKSKQESMDIIEKIKAREQDKCAEQ